VIAKSLFIDGPGEGRIIIDAGANGRDFHIVGGASVVLSGLTIRGGNEFCGGGIRVDAPASLRLANSLVSDNLAVFGGGICSSSSALLIVGSTVAGNTATISGGGIYTTGVTTMVNATFSANQAAEFGGGIFNLNQLSVRSSTIVRNTGTGGGSGIYNAGVASMINTLLVANPFLSTNADCGGGAVTSLGHNLLVPWGGCTPNVPAGDLVIVARVTVSAFFDPNLADNGGPTPTHAIFQQGFAVDAGICANGETTDQRGLPRPYDEPLAPNAADGCDIGAFEWQPATRKK
jgi:hypothetical protein